MQAQTRARFVAALSALQVVAAAAACAGSGEPPAGDRSGSTPPSLLAAPGGCSPTPIHYERLPGAARAGLPAMIPWVEAPSGRAVGILFYFGTPAFRGTRPSVAVIGTRGRAGKDGATKILWWVHAGSPGGTLTVAGTRLDRPGSFRQELGPADGASVNPSIISVPRPGCWRLDLRAGEALGSVTFRALDRPRRR